jgi:hypothetical protein
LDIVPKLRHHKKIVKGAFLPYPLIEDATYPMSPWFYSPFKIRKKDCQEQKCIGTSYNLVPKWQWKGLLEF